MKLINWKALEELSKMEPESQELICIDPPYNIIASKWDKYIDFNKFFEIAWKKITKNWSIIIFASWSFTPRVMMSSINEYKYKYVWIKNTPTNFVHSKNRPMTKHEDILVFSKAPMGHISQIWEERRMIYNPQGLIKVDKTIKQWNWRFWTITWNRPSHKKTEETFKREFSNYPTDVIDNIPELPTNKRLHTSQKPVKLLKKLLLTHSNWWPVADLFMWSWSFGVAVKEVNQEIEKFRLNPIEFTGVELDEWYYKISCDRLWIKY